MRPQIKISTAYHFNITYNGCEFCLLTPPAILDLPKCILKVNLWFHLPRSCSRHYTVFMLSVRVCVSQSVTFCFLNILKSHCWYFVKLCKHIYIYKTNTLNKKVRLGANFIRIISLCNAKWLFI